MTSHIYRDVILEQHVHLFWGVMGAEFLFMDDNTRPHRANIVDQCLQSENITLWFRKESVASEAAIVGDHHCHTPRHCFKETLDVFLGLID
ncbi:DDE_3 domain-containing protein [Trichonephila clavipes]|nr:DDE_3 domain-containing protein [Trichonephila clavipes]